MKRDIPYPRNILMSYHYFKDYDLDRLPHLRIIGDSGAFSAASQGAVITTGELAEWGKKWRHKLAWIAALDVIGDPRATYRNWRDMVDNYGVKAVPTIHYGTDPAEMDKYARKGVDFMGLGGLVGREGKAQMRWLIQVFKYQRKHHPDMKFHGWGCTAERHASLPFYSVDSSSWTAGVRYGSMRLRHPRSGKAVTYRLDGKEAFKPSVARLLIDHYGASPKGASFSDSSNRTEMVRLSALASSVQEQRLRKMHGPIPAPSWGINHRTHVGAMETTGPHLHLATGSQDEVRLNALHEPEPGPHLHLATFVADNASPDAVERLHNKQEGIDGPHLHLATTGPYFPQLNKYHEEEGSDE